MYAQFRREPPMKVVASKKGLATIFLLCASFGFVAGILLQWIVRK